MSMQVASLEVLEKANLPAPQARAIVQAIEIEIAGARDTLATKQDTLLLRQDMAELGHDLRQEMSKLGHDVRQEMLDMRHGLELKIEGMRSELHASASSISRQMYGALVGQMAVLLLGIAYFFRGTRRALSSAAHSRHWLAVGYRIERNREASLIAVKRHGPVPEIRREQHQHADRGTHRVLGAERGRGHEARLAEGEHALVAPGVAHAVG